VLLHAYKRGWLLLLPLPARVGAGVYVGIPAPAAAADAANDTYVGKGGGACQAC